MAEVTYYFDVRSLLSWTFSPSNMIDGFLTTYASETTDGKKQELTETTGPGIDLGTITKVELRVYAYGDGDDRIDLSFVVTMNPEYQTTPGTSAGWGAYQDVTADPIIDGWTWAKVASLPECELFVELDCVAKANTMYCAKVEIRVTYTPEAPPEGVPLQMMHYMRMRRL